MTRIKFAFSPSITNESYHIRHGCRRRYNRGPARGGRVHVCMIQGHKLPYTLPICEEKRGTQPSQAQVIAPLPRERRPPLITLFSLYPVVVVVVVSALRSLSRDRGGFLTRAGFLLSVRKRHFVCDNKRIARAQFCPLHLLSPVVGRSHRRPRVKALFTVPGTERRGHTGRRTKEKWFRIS